MFKLVILGCLLFLAYRVFGGPSLIDEKRKDDYNDPDQDDTDYTDYEEIDWPP